MVRPLPARACALLCLSLALGVAAFLCWRYAADAAPRTPHAAVAAADSAPAAAPRSDGPFCWGGALNSARLEGAGFFDRRGAAAFAAGVGPELRKYVVELNARALLPLPGDEHLAAVCRGNAAQSVVYLQFVNHPRPDQRARVADAGVELLSYVAGYAWAARGKAQAFRAALQLDFVRAVARIDPRDKLHPQVFRGDVPPYAAAPGGRARLTLLARPGTTAEEISAQLSRAVERPAPAASPRDASVLGPRFEVVAAIALAPRIAAADSAAFIEFAAPPAGSRDAVTDVVSNIGDVRDNPPNLDGSGVWVAVREVGGISAHVDFNPRLTRIDSNGATDATNVNHATAVAGQIGSNGAAQAPAKGVAPAVTMYGYVVGGNESDFATTDAVNAAGRGARVSNHSYGPVGVTAWGDYQTISADWDAVIAANNLVGAFAQYEETSGNVYTRTDFFVGAKNTICVGAVNSSARAGDVNPFIVPAGGLAYFTDFGPMNDGRIKPDLVAYGENVTLDQGTNSTQVLNGTSFATPVVTGVAALVFQRYKQLTNGLEPSGALTKALLCNSATDVGPAGPDAQYGFGILNADEAINTVNLLTNPGGGPFYENAVGNGQTAAFSANLLNVPLLRVTLCWLDPAGDPAVAKALVNDLDLTLQAPDGTLYYPYSLNPANPSAPAMNTVPNTVDPIEQVVVSSPPNGTWTVLVKGTSVPSGTQAFAVCLNQPTQPPPLSAVILATPETGEGPLTVTFSGVFSTGDVASYHWDYGDGSAGDGRDTSHTYNSSGTFTVTLTVTDPKGQAASTTKVITVTGLAIVASPYEGFAPLLVSFAPLTTKPNVSYVWNFGDGTQFAGATADHTYMTAGTFTVTLKLTDAQGKTLEAAPVTITVRKGTVQAFPGRARLKLDFSGRGDSLQFVMVVPALVLTPQQSRDALHDGTYEGNSYTISLNGSVINCVNAAPAKPVTMVLDRRASFKGTIANPPPSPQSAAIPGTAVNAARSAVSFKLNPVKGEITIALKGLALAQALGISAATPSFSLVMAVDVSGTSTVYHTEYNLTYKSNGQTGNASSR